jgi:hypothetical protein
MAARGASAFWGGLMDASSLLCGKPFNPAPKLKAAMEKGVVDAYYYMQELDTKLFASNLYWPDRHWSFVMVPDEKHRFDFVSDDAVQIDKRAACFFFYTFYPEVLTDHAATVYLNPIPSTRMRTLPTMTIHRRGCSTKCSLPKPGNWSYP